MATRRKGYKSGGAVPRDGGGGAVEMPDVAPDEGTAAAPAPNPIQDPVLYALRQTERAEEFQRQYAARVPQSLAEQIETDPNISAPQRAFLRQHPHVLSDPRALMFYVHAARSRGIKDDTPEFFDTILRGFEREHERGVEHAKHLAEMKSQPHRAVEKAHERADEIEERALAMVPGAQPPPKTPSAPAPPESRRSIPVSAPVHRDVPTFSGNRESHVDVRLTAEERDIARRSYSAPDMTDAQKEYEYWRQREKLRAMRRDGTYRHTTDQTG
jgi:hypothetical protein